MTTLDHAIVNLTQLFQCFEQAGQLEDARKVLHELWAYQDVRDGVPRWQREMAIHHADWRDKYCAARRDAELLAAHREERESQP